MPVPGAVRLASLIVFPDRASIPTRPRRKQFFVFCGSPELLASRPQVKKKVEALPFLITLNQFGSVNRETSGVRGTADSTFPVRYC